MKFTMLINVKMPTIVGILTFISMVNTPSKSLKARNVFIFQHLSFYEKLKFHAQLSRAQKMVYNLRTGPVCTISPGPGKKFIFMGNSDYFLNHQFKHIF